MVADIPSESILGVVEGVCELVPLLIRASGEVWCKPDAKDIINESPVKEKARGKGWEEFIFTEGKI